MRVASKATKGAWGRKSKTWRKGQSCLSNPSLKKFRLKARHEASDAGNELTVSSLATHNTINFGNLKLTDNEDDDMKSDKESVKTFASIYSNCTNINFEDFLNNWTADTPLEKEMLAVLTSATESIKEKGGNQTTTEFFACLMTTLEGAKDVNVISATVELLKMVTSKVSVAVFRHGFSRFSEILLATFNRCKGTTNVRLLRGLIHCLGCISRGLDGVSWKDPPNRLIIECLLNYGQHSEPEVRKSVRRALMGIVSVNHSDPNKTAAVLIASMIVSLMKEVNIKDKNLSSLVCLLSMLRSIIAEVPSSTLKKCCEVVLSFMTLEHLKVSCAGLDVLDGIFAKQTACGLTEQMSNQIFNALFEFIPGVSEPDLVIKWVTTTGNVLLFWNKNYPSLYASGVSRVTKAFVSFFSSVDADVHASVSQGLKSILESSMKVPLDFEVISDVSRSIDCSLELRYSHAWSSSLVCVAEKFAAYGSKHPIICMESLKILVGLRQSHQFNQYEELDKTVGAAVKSMGPQVVLQVIHLDVDAEKGKVETAWIIPILRQFIETCEISFFVVFFIPLAVKFKTLSERLQEANPVTAKNLDLMFQQIWSLLPCFLYRGTDIIDSFGKIAPVLGKSLKQWPEVRTVILSGLRKVCKRVETSKSRKERDAVGKYSKNFLPILLNLYTSEEDMKTKEQQLAVFETVASFLRITDASKAVDLYQKTVERYDVTDRSDTFLVIAYLDMMRSYIPFLDKSSIQHLVSHVAQPLFKSKNQRYCKKSFRIIEEVCKSSSQGAKEFVADHLQEVLIVVLEALESVPPSVLSAPLNGLRHLISQFFVLIPSEMETVVNRLIPLIFKCLMNPSRRTRVASVELMKTLTTAAFMTNSGVALIKNHLRQFLTHEGYGDRALMVITLLFDILTSKITDIELRQLLNLIYTPRNSQPMVRSVVTFSKVLMRNKTSDELLPLLPFIMGWLKELNVNLKKSCRLVIRELIIRLVKKFGLETINKLIPEDLAKVLKNIRKKELRKKSKKTEDDMEDMLDDQTNDYSDDEEGDEDELQVQHKKSRMQMEEDMDDFDLLSGVKTVPVVAKKKVEEKEDDGISFGPDGKLVIRDISKKRKRDDDDDDDEEEEEEIPTVKQETRKASMAYKHGGKGIHRDPRAKDLGMKTGNQYKSKRAKGDVKKKDQSVDPYAYFPLLKSSLNKRHRASMKGQFKALKQKTKTGRQ